MIKDPLLWFLLTGVVLFSANHVFVNEREKIIIDADLRTQLVSRWQAQMQRDPSDEEIDAITRSWLEEEVLYREAVRLNLADNDTIVRRRLVQKVSFLIEDVAEAQLNEDDVVAFYEQYKERYIQPERISFQQAYYPSAEEASAALNTRANDEYPVGPASLINQHFVGRTEREISREFGAAFFNTIVHLPLDTWHGPVESQLGVHLVKIENLDAPSVLPLARIADQVRADLMAQRKRQARQAQINRLLDAANVVFKD